MLNNSLYRPLSIKLALILCAALLSNVFAQEQSAIQLFNQANSYYNSGEYKKAIILYRKAQRRGTDPATIAFNIANSFYQTGDLPSAAAAYRRAIALSQGRLTNAKFNLAAVHFQLRNYGESIAIYHRALSSEPENVSAWLYLAEASERIGDLIGTQRALETALSLDMEDIGIVYQLAEVHLKLSEADRAVELVRTIYELRPDETDLLFYIGDIYYNDRNYEMAIASWREGLSAAPNNFTAHYRIADLMVQQGNRFLAMEHLSRALEINPEFTDASLFLGNIAFDLQWWDRSLGAYLQALEHNDSEGIVGIINILYEAVNRGDIRRAEETVHLLSGIAIDDPIVQRDFDLLRAQLQ